MQSHIETHKNLKVFSLTQVFAGEDFGPSVQYRECRIIKGSYRSTGTCEVLHLRRHCCRTGSCWNSGKKKSGEILH